MGGRLSDLNTHLFAQLDRLSAGGMEAEQIETEVRRAEAIVAVADQVVRAAEAQLKAAKLFAEHRDVILPYLPWIGRAE